MRQKSTVFTIAFLLVFPLLGFALPQLAILEALLAAGIDPTVGPLVTSKIEEEFVNSGKYTVLDRANIDQILREKEFQLSSGIVRNEEVRQAGEYLGADLIVSVNVSRVGQTFVVTAKMIDVVSGEIAAQTSNERQGRIDVLLDIAKVVGGRLAGTEIIVIEVEEPEPEEPEEEVAEAPKAEPVPKPPRERKPVEFKRFVVGVKAGGNLATARTDSWGDWEFWDFAGTSLAAFGHFSDQWAYGKFGLVAGGYAVVNLNNYLGVQAELLFSQKGYQYDFIDYDAGFVSIGWVTNRFTLSYFELPLLLKGRLPGRYSPYVVAGVSIAMLLGVAVENIYENAASQSFYESFWGSGKFDLLEWGWDYNSFDAGLVAGAGIDILFGRIILNLEARYTLGLLPPSAVVGYTNGALTFTGGAGFQF